jgi:hypothetical protein
VAIDIIVANMLHGTVVRPEHPSIAILGFTFGAASNAMTDGIIKTQPIDEPINPFAIAIVFTIGFICIYIRDIIY